jgi:hypothetical protein
MAPRLSSATRSPAVQSLKNTSVRHTAATVTITVAHLRALHVIHTRSIDERAGVQPDLQRCHSVHASSDTTAFLLFVLGSRVSHLLRAAKDGHLRARGVVPKLTATSRAPRLMRDEEVGCARDDSTHALSHGVSRQYVAGYAGQEG